MKVLYISLIIVIIDQVTKLCVKGFSLPHLKINFRGMYPGQTIHLLGDWFNITFVENPGIAFGIDFGGNYKLLISIFTIAATTGLFLYFFYMKDKSRGMRLSLAFIIGGAVGNLIDRAFYGLLYGYAPFLHGMVVDFIDIRFFDFFVFSKTFGNYILNFADLAVTAGVILLLFSYSRQTETSEMAGTPALSIEETEMDTNQSSDNFLIENKD